MRISDWSSDVCPSDLPLHPYTEALLAAAPLPEPGLKRERLILQGDVPSPMRPPPGCHFHTRCPYAVDRCRRDTPALTEVQPDHWVACHLRPPGDPFGTLTPTICPRLPRSRIPANLRIPHATVLRPHPHRDQHLPLAPAQNTNHDR